jgi:hypothetical protein
MVLFCLIPALAFAQDTSGNDAGAAGAGGADAELAGLTLDAGEVSVEAAKADNAFKVNTPSGVVAVRGTKFVVDVAGDGKGQVHVLDGQVSFTNDAGEVLLEVGKMIDMVKDVIPQLQGFDLGQYQDILNLWEGGITKGKVRDFIKGKIKEKVKGEVIKKLGGF